MRINNKLWFSALSFVLFSSALDLVTTHYAIFCLKGFTEANTLMSPYLGTLWILLIEALYIIWEWAFPYLLSRKYSYFNLLIVAPLFFAGIRLHAGLNNLSLILRVTL